MRSWVIAFRTYGLPNHKDLLALIILSLVGGFIFTYNKFDNISEQLEAYVLIGIAIFLFLMATEFGRRIWASTKGYEVRTKLWIAGLVISVFFCIYTNGYLTFLLPGGFKVKELVGYRFGQYQDRLKIQDLAWISIWGLIFGLVSIALLYGFSPFYVVVALLIINLAMMVPIDLITVIIDKSTPPSPGTQIFIRSRPLYITLVLILVLSFAFFYIVGSFWGLISGLIIGIALGIYYYLKVL